MVVVVLGFEEYEIHEPHRNVQTRMNRAASEHFRVEAFESVYDFAPALAKRSRDRRCGNVVVVCLAGCFVGDVGGVQDVYAGDVLLDSIKCQSVEIEKVSGVFLDGPAAVVTTGQSFRGGGL